MNDDSKYRQQAGEDVADPRPGDSWRRAPHSPSSPQPGEIDEDETANEPPDVVHDDRHHWPQPDHSEEKGKAGQQPPPGSPPD